MGITWHQEIRALKDLKQNPKNPRYLDKIQGDLLNDSMKKFGLCEPLVVNVDGAIIGGHQRYKLLKKNKVKEAPVNVPSRALSDNEMDELMVRLNKNTGAWDFDILANDFEIGDLVEWGFTHEEFKIDPPIAVEQEETEIDKENFVNKEPKSKLGEVYELGNHRLMCGDSTNPDHVAKLLNGETPILMVTDPPYGVNYDPEWREKNLTKAKRALGKVQNDDQLNWALAYSLFPGSVAYIWHSFKMPVTTLNAADFDLIAEIIWVKQHFAISRGDYHWQHEPCWYAVKKGHKHNWQGSRKESTVWEIANLNTFGRSNEERTSHSTQKPIECMKRPIINNSAPGEGVYDPFGGSGTTLIACEQTDRKCYMMEIDPVYVDMIIERWKGLKK